MSSSLNIYSLSMFEIFTSGFSQSFVVVSALLSSLGSFVALLVLNRFGLNSFAPGPVSLLFR